MFGNQCQLKKKEGWIKLNKKGHFSLKRLTFLYAMSSFLKKPSKLIYKEDKKQRSESRSPIKNCVERQTLFNC